MVQAQACDQPVARFTWRTLAGLFDEAWHREQRRLRRWLVALAVLIAAGLLAVALNGGGRHQPAKPGANAAATHRPGTASVNNRGLPAPIHLTILPQTVNSRIPVGVPKVFKVQLISRSDTPVTRPGVPVYLTQSTYGGTGKTHPSVIINGKPAGQRYVRALSDPQGIATFTIIATKASFRPTAFNALLEDKPLRFQYGVTGDFIVRFSAPKNRT